MKEHLKIFGRRLKARLLPLLDLSALLLLVLSVGPMIIINPAMILTLISWTAYGLALAGISVMLNRLVLPQIKLKAWLGEAYRGNIAASIVVASVLGLLAVFFIGLVVWAKG